jgi:hypothetical protein
MDRETRAILAWVGASVLGILMTGNAFFVKRLVDNIDILSDKVAVLQVQVSVIDSRLSLVLKDASVQQPRRRIQSKKPI